MNINTLARVCINRMYFFDVITVYNLMKKTSIVKINVNNIQCIEIVFILLKNVFYPLNSPNYLRFN